MTSILRLKGRALQIGNSTLFTLIFLTAVMLVFSVGLLPSVYMKGFEAYAYEYSGGHGALVSFFVALIFYMVLISVCSAVRMGVKRFFLRKAQHKGPSSKDFFFYFRPVNFFRCVFYSLRIGLVRFVIFIVCLLPCGICLFFLYRFSLSAVSALVCFSFFLTAICLFVNGVYFFGLFFSSFFLCDYYFVDGSFISFSHITASSQKMMLHRNKLLMKLKLSFSGWFLLCFLVFPLPYVWSYYNQCLAVAAEEFMKGKKE